MSTSLGEVIGLFIVGTFVAVFSIIKIVAQWIQRRRAMPPYRRALRRATDGAFLLALAIYASTWFPSWLGRSVDELFSRSLLAPRNTPTEFWVFAAAIVIGLMLLITGIFGARRGGDRDLMSAFWAVTIACGCVYLMWWGWYLPLDGDPSTREANIFLKGLYIAALTASLVRAWLCLPRPGNALKIVARHIERGAVVWRSARRRSTNLGA